MGLVSFFRRLYFHWVNSDPVKNCPVYREEGCSHVDGMLCDWPNCHIYHEYMGDKFVGCAGCELNECCCGRSYGLGCYDGIEKAK